MSLEEEELAGQLDEVGREAPDRCAQIRRGLTAAIAMTLEDLSDIEISTLNLAVALGGFVDKMNLVFDKAVELKLIQTTVYPFDREALTAALTMEIERRPAFQVDSADLYEQEMWEAE